MNLVTWRRTCKRIIFWCGLHLKCVVDYTQRDDSKEHGDHIAETSYSLKEINTQETNREHMELHDELECGVCSMSMNHMLQRG